LSIFLSNKITSTFEMKKKLAILIVVLFLTLLVNFSNTQTHHDPNIKPEDEMLGVVEITSEEQEKKEFRGKLPVFVFAYRKTCIHSIKSAPYFARVAKKIHESKFKNLIILAKVDVKQQYYVGLNINVHGTPAFLLIQDHKEPHGYQTKVNIKKKIKIQRNTTETNL
jgi:hypothetical protein